MLKYVKYVKSNILKEDRIFVERGKGWTKNGQKK